LYFYREDIYKFKRKFIALNEIGLASPSNNTAALPIFTGGWPSGGATTIPLVWLYLEAAAEVNKTVVMVVPGSVSNANHTVSIDS